MTQQNESGMLDTPQARSAFRSRYDESVFKAAYSITGSYRQAQLLTQALFEDMEHTFRSQPLPQTPQLYMLSRINLLYARNEWQQPRSAAKPPRPKEAAAPEPPDVWIRSDGVVLGEVVYLPQKRQSSALFAPSGLYAQPVPVPPSPMPDAAVEEPPEPPAPAEAPQPVAAEVPPAEPPAAPPAPEKPPEPVVEAAPAVIVEPLAMPVLQPVAVPVVALRQEEQAAPPPEAKPAPAPRAPSLYDPELTAEWSPGMEEEAPPAPPAPAEPTPRVQEKDAAEQKAESRPVREKERRSVPLTVLNILLTAGVIGAAVYLLWSLNVL